MIKYVLWVGYCVRCCLEFHYNDFGVIITFYVRVNDLHAVTGIGHGGFGNWRRWFRESQERRWDSDLWRATRPSFFGGEKKCSTKKKLRRDFGDVVLSSQRSKSEVKKKLKSEQKKKSNCIRIYIYRWIHKKKEFLFSRSGLQINGVSFILQKIEFSFILQINEISFFLPNIVQILKIRFSFILVFLGPPPSFLTMSALSCQPRFW